MRTVTEDKTISYAIDQSNLKLLKLLATRIHDFGKIKLILNNYKYYHVLEHLCFILNLNRQ